MDISHVFQGSRACTWTKITSCQSIQNLSLSLQMFATRNLFSAHIGTALVHFIYLQSQICSAQTNHLCAPFTSGNIQNISSPLRLKEDPPHCGYSEIYIFLFVFIITTPNNTNPTCAPSGDARPAPKQLK
jgi:hypothetical protein